MNTQPSTPLHPAVLKLLLAAAICALLGISLWGYGAYQQQAAQPRPEGGDAAAVVRPEPPAQHDGARLRRWTHTAVWHRVLQRYHSRRRPRRRRGLSLQRPPTRPSYPRGGWGRFSYPAPPRWA